MLPKTGPTDRPKKNESGQFGGEGARTMGAICFKSNVIEPLRVDTELLELLRMIEQDNGLANVVKVLSEFDALLGKEIIGTMKMAGILRKSRIILKRILDDILDDIYIARSHQDFVVYIYELQDALELIKDVLRRIEEIDHINDNTLDLLATSLTKVPTIRVWEMGLSRGLLIMRFYNP
jgi:hypothetical protein